MLDRVWLAESTIRNFVAIQKGPHQWVLISVLYVGPLKKTADPGSCYNIMVILRSSYQLWHNTSKMDSINNTTEEIKKMSDVNKINRRSQFTLCKWVSNNKEVLSSTLIKLQAEQSWFEDCTIISRTIAGLSNLCCIPTKLMMPLELTQ